MKRKLHNGFPLSGTMYLFLLSLFLCFGAKAQTPGGRSNINLWLKADAGVNSTTNTLTGWVDQIGTNTFTVFGNPQTGTSQLNFNNIIDFDATGDYLDGNTAITFNEVFLVAKTNNAGVVLGGDGVFGGCGAYLLRNSGVSLAAGDTDPSYLATNGEYNGFQIYNVELAGGANATESRIAVNGTDLTVYALGAGDSGPLSPFTLTPVVGRCGNGSEFLDGSIAEIVVWNSSAAIFPDQDRMYINSYLAIKYGITLSHIYYASGWTIWNPSVNANYNNDIAGIGRDDVSALNQLKSKSINNGTIVTVEAANLPNDKSFIVWGSNGGDMDFEVNAGDYIRTNRAWRVQETYGAAAVDLDVKVRIPDTYDEAVYLLVDDTDDDFSSGATRINLVDNGNGYLEAVVNFDKQSYFTFAKDAPMAAPGNAITFDGTDDFITIDGSFGNIPETTVEAWIRVDATTGAIQSIVSPIAQEFIHLQIFDSNSAIVAYTDGGHVILNMPAFIPNQWHHYAFSIKSGDTRLFVDGVQYGATNQTTFSNISGTSNLMIGQGHNNLRYFNGGIDEVRIWNKALTLTEVRENIYTPIASPTTEANLIAYYKFDQLSGNFLLDEKDNHNGTLDATSANNWSESYALVAPKPKAATGITESGFTANWETPITGTTTGYYIDVDDNVNFSSPQTFTENSATSHKITGLTGGTKYFYRVRAYKTSTGDVGDWHYMNPISVSIPTGFVHVDGSVATSGDGSKNSPFKTIGEAVAASSNGNAIMISSGVYAETVNIDKDISLIGEGANKTRIDGKGNGTVITIGSGVKAQIEGIFITGGNKNGNGGGIFNEGELNLKQCQVEGNQASGNGGGVYSTGVFTVDGCGFFNNTSPEGSAVYQNGSGNLSIKSSTFALNSGNGAAVSIATTGTAGIVNSTFNNNKGIGLNITNGTLDLINTIIANSNSGTDFQISAPGVLGLNNNNLVQYGLPTATFSTNPNFKPLAYYKGIGYYPLQMPSDAINNGTASGAPSVDICGNPIVGNIDLGASEYQEGTTTWDGNGWTNGTPDANTTVIIDAPYSVGISENTNGFNAKNLIITGNGELVVNGGQTINVVGNVEVNNLDGGKITIPAPTGNKEPGTINYNGSLTGYIQGPPPAVPLSPYALVIVLLIGGAVLVTKQRF